MTNTGELASNRIPRSLSIDTVSVMERVRACAAVVRQACTWLTRRGQDVLTRGGTRRLKVAETVSLGEKRFVSIVQVDGEQFLLGGSPSNIVLLAKLETKPGPEGVRSFDNILSRVDVCVERSEVDNKNPTGATR